MVELKTKQTRESVSSFISSVQDEKRRNDAKKLLKIFKEATGLSAKMWGTSIVGFGSYHYKSERSKQEGDWPLTGFSPRKQNLTIYVMSGTSKHRGLLQKIGPHKSSVGCLYLKRLSDAHLPTLKALIKESVKEMRKNYPSS